MYTLFTCARRWTVAIALLLGTALAAATLPASAEIFLQGKYIEVGIHNAGSFGTSAGAPSGFHPKINASDRRLGFVADPGKDGWGVGTPPQTGDYFVPGTPEEGWTVEWTSPSGTERQFHNYGLMGSQNVLMQSLTETSSGNTKSAVWVGTAQTGAEKLSVTQTVSFDVNDLFFVINVVMTNTGTVALNSLEYMRNVDPDQEQPLTGNFTTRNWVEFQPGRQSVAGRPDRAAFPPGNIDKALSVAQGLTYGLTLGLGAIDTRATVAASHGFSNRDPDIIINTPTQPTPAAPSTADSAIVLAYNLGSLAPGQSVSLTYTYILNKADLSVALGRLAAVSILQPSGTVSGSSVLFQATTNDVANTRNIDFYVNGVLVGSDTTPAAGGIFEAGFNSRLFPNGTANLKVVATFANGNTIERLTTVTIDNAGPPVAFSTPTAGQTFTGAGIPIAISVLDQAHPPVRVSFFREVLGASLFLSEDSSAPFISSFSVSDLAAGQAVVIKAVATDSLGRVTTIQVSGVVQTNRAPVAHAGDDQTVEQQNASGANVTLNGTASSDPDGDALTFTWSGPFGVAGGAQPTVRLPAGVSTVTLSVHDGHVYSGSDTVNITVRDSTAPEVIAPADITAEATGVLTVVAIGSATANDAVGVTSIGNDAPEQFPLGTTVVVWRAQDAAGNIGTATQRITVRDTTPPQLTVPGDRTVEAIGSLTPVDIGHATATDVFTVTVSHNAPASFPLGLTSVTWTATDANGNSVTGVQKITVIDTTPPRLGLSDDITAEATSRSGAVVSFTNTAVDTVSGNVPVVCTPDAGSIFPLGATNVQCSATDGSGNRATGRFSVTVQDTTAPVLTPPADITVEATGVRTTVLLGDAVATDIFPVTLRNDRPADFPLGTTLVSWTATDANGNRTVKVQKVTVADTTAPTFSFNQTTRTIWPPNHKMVLVATLANVRDAVTASPTVDIKVTSNQPVNARGDGNTAVDWKVVQTGSVWQVWVLAERAGPGQDRVYSITTGVSDAAGNSASASGTVTVPHDQRSK